MTKNVVSGIVYRELDRVRVKGKDEPVLIYQPLGFEEKVDYAELDELKLFQRALKLYRTQNWDLAELQLINLQKMAPSVQLYQLFLERIKHLRANTPQAGWDGVWVFESK